jgi:hypothetical protein
MKAPFNNNPPNQTNNVMVNPRNPVNPDSKPQATAHLMHNQRLNLIAHSTLKWCIFGK